jgi:FKBP-type peptidyl-prolyl cis-trans isomerase (trigger factor)
MDIQKPLPLMLGGKAYYTLSRTDPVVIEVVVPQVTEEEVDLALQDIASQAGAQDLNDPAWLQTHFGAKTFAEVRDHLRAQMTDANYSLLEHQRAVACASALAERLGQAIPPAFLQEVRQQVEANFVAQMRAGNRDLDSMLGQMGATRDMLSKTFDQQALSIAQQDVALATFARDRGLDVAEEDYPRLLKMPASQVIELVKQAKATGQESQIRESALRNRALEVLVAECVCHYRHESDEEAAERVERLKQQRERTGEGRAAAPSARRTVNPNLKLV